MQFQKSENEFKYNVNLKGLALAHEFMTVTNQQMSDQFVYR